MLEPIGRIPSRPKETKRRIKQADQNGQVINSQRALGRSGPILPKLLCIFLFRVQVRLKEITVLSPQTSQKKVKAPQK